MKLKSEKARVSYDYGEDILFARPINRKYSASVQMGAFVFDLDEEKKLVGVEILDASKVFNIPKLVIQNARTMKMEILVEGNIILTRGIISSVLRNAKRESNIEIERIRPEIMEPSQLQLVYS